MNIIKYSDCKFLGSSQAVVVSEDSVDSLKSDEAKEFYSIFILYNLMKLNGKKLLVS